MPVELAKRQIATHLGARDLIFNNFKLAQDGYYGLGDYGALVQPKSLKVALHLVAGARVVLHPAIEELLPFFPTKMRTENLIESRAHRGAREMHLDGAQR